MKRKRKAVPAVPPETVDGVIHYAKDYMALTGYPIIVHERLYQSLEEAAQMHGIPWPVPALIQSQPIPVTKKGYCEVCRRNTAAPLFDGCMRPNCPLGWVPAL